MSEVKKDYSTDSLLKMIRKAGGLRNMSIMPFGNTKYLDYIFLLPGHPSSGIQAINAEVARLNLAATGKRVGLQPAYSCDIYVVRNGCLGAIGFDADQKPFQGEYEYDRLIWVDSDNIISSDKINELISRNVDIVAAWCRQYGSGDINNNNRANCGFFDIENRVSGVSPGKCVERGLTVGEMLEYAKKDELLEVDYVGFSLMIIKKGVFESMKYPWFEPWVLEWEENGRLKRRIIQEDVGFCIKARKHGYKVYVDPTVMIQHEKRVLL
jgi:hypothetical protein